VTGFVVYSRRGCHLCELLIEQLLEELAGKGEPEIRDIDSKPEWRTRFDTRVPVLEYNGDWVCDYHLDVERVRRIIRGADASKDGN
jgi:hypothetical protein